MKKKLLKYYTKGSTGIMEEYSGSFRTRKIALQWYEEHGRWLEEKFNRKLILK